MADKISGKDQMLDTFKGEIYQELTDMGVRFIHENVPKAVEAIKNGVRDVYVAMKDAGKSELKVDGIIRNLCDKSMAEGCEVGYQVGRQQKMQMMLYGMSKAGLHIDQIKQIFAATKEAEEEFGDSYDTYEHYLVTWAEIKRGR